MAKSVLELAVGTGQWDAGLKKAKNALDNFTQANGGLQSALNKDSASMQKFVQMMGQMDSTAKTAKGQMNDYKGTIEALTMQYNRMTDAQKAAVGQTYLQAIDQMKQKYQGVAQEVTKINQELKHTNELSAGTGRGGGGLFGGGKLDGMLQVFGGNVLTKVAGMGVGFVSEMGDMVKQGIELARAGEGVRIAFERLNQPGLLDNLREATHGTVTDLELMKAAVKFNDFKLPLEELGTMLAFAQQKAKDTGQSVDYMVNSIVTGLGRKSKLILDNLGISAAEIDDKMKETGDMTKAVGEIIREQMAKAGDYIETAADRATKANVELENAMTRLGETFQPLTDAANDMWTSIKVSALDLLNNAIKPLINAFTEAGRARALYENQGGDARVNRQLDRLRGIQTDNYRQGTYKAQLRNYDTQIASHEQYLRDYKAWQGDNTNVGAYNRMQAFQQQTGLRWVTDVRAHLDAFKKMRSEYVQGAKAILEAIPAPSPAAPATTSTTTTTTTTRGNKSEPLSAIAFDINKAALAATKGMDGGPSDVFAAYKDSLVEQTSVVGQLTEAFKALNNAEGVDRDEQRESDRRRKRKNNERNPYLEYGEDGKSTARLNNVLGGISGGIGQMVDGLESMGITIPNEIKSAIGILQGVSTILTGISTTLLAIEAISAADTIIPFAHGGVVPRAANGYFVPGTRYSADVTPIMANSGELVLNKSSQGNLANDLKGAEALVQTIDRYQESIMRGSQYSYGTPTLGGGMLGNMKMEAMITGEQIRLVLNNNGRRTGRGEYVQTINNKQQ